MRRRAAIFLLLLLLSSTSQLQAGGSVDLPTIQKILQQSPQTWKHLDHVFHFADVGGATRLGRHWTHLGGSRVAPYVIRVTSKADPTIRFQLMVRCRTVFYDADDQPVDAKHDTVFTESVRIEEKFLSIQLTPVEAKAEERSGTGRPSQ